MPLRFVSFQFVPFPSFVSLYFISCLEERTVLTVYWFVSQLPVVLENCTFHKSALKWTVEYLEENLQDEDHTAYVSHTRRFLYYDDDRIKGAYKDFKPPTKQTLLYFSNFTKLIKELERADNGSRAYFQVKYTQRK